MSLAWWRSIAAVIAVSALMAVTGMASCAEQATPQESVESLREKSPTLRNKQRLRIGVWEDVPYMYYIDPKTHERSGFEIELAKSVAESLGFTEDRIDWVPVRTLAERQSALGQNRVDVVIASFSMTEEREKLVGFAGPYQLVPQAVLARTDRAKTLETIEDLRAPGVRVCTTNGSTSERALKDKGITPLPVDTNVDCVNGLKSGRYDAFSTDLSVLAGFLRADRESSGKKLLEILKLGIAAEDERLGIAVRKDDPALRKLITYYLYRWYRAGQGGESTPWLRAYDHTIGTELDPARYRSQPAVDHADEVEDLADYDSKGPQ